MAAFEPRRQNRSKLKKTKYKHSGPTFRRLVLIATQMADPRRNPSDPGYLGIPPVKTFRMTIVRNFLHGRHVFKKQDWDAWLFVSGWVELKRDIPQTQADLIHNGLVEQLSESRYRVSKAIQRIGKAKEGLPFESAEPVMQLDDGDYTLYSFNNGLQACKRQVVPSSQALILDGCERAPVILLDTKPKKVNNSSADSSSATTTTIRWLRRRETMASRNLNRVK